MKQYHNYIFDLYGTLIDIETDENRLLFWKKLAERFQLGDNYSALRKQYLSLCEKAQKKNPLVHAEIDLAPIFRELFQTDDDQKIAYMAYEFRKMSRKKFRLFPGVTETLETIRKRGGHCYLLSNAQALFTSRAVSALRPVPTSNTRTTRNSACIVRTCKSTIYKYNE